MIDHIDAQLERQRATQPKPLDADILEALQQIGLHNPDPADPLHVRLVNALIRTRGAVWGDQLVALKFEFNWAQYQAGREFVQAKVDYEHHLDSETVRLMGTPNEAGKFPTRAVAEQTVRATSTAYDLQLAFLFAEKREQSLRKFLDTLQHALDNHRTNRADWRAGDTEHTRSGT